MTRPRRRPLPRAYPGDERLVLRERIAALEEQLAVSEGERRASAEALRRVNVKLADGELP